MTVRAAIDGALAKGKRIFLRSYLLRDAGENALQEMVLGALEYYGRSELAGAVHAAVRELVQNASKAALKRIVFEELGLDPHKDTDYQEGMSVFRKYLVESQLAHYRRKFARRGLHFTVEIQHSRHAVVISVNNRAMLLPHEEERIREKFVLARALDNLFDFYIKFGDNTEGAGMGIAMVEILLEEAGIERHNFTIFCEPEAGHTAARIIVPLSADYVTPRLRFERLLESAGVDAETLRAQVRSGQLQLDPLQGD